VPASDLWSARLTEYTIGTATPGTEAAWQCSCCCCTACCRLPQAHLQFPHPDLWTARRVQDITDRNMGSAVLLLLNTARTARTAYAAAGNLPLLQAAASLQRRYTETSTSLVDIGTEVQASSGGAVVATTTTRQLVSKETVTASPCFADLAARLALTPEEWALVPGPDPCLARALPAVLACSTKEAGLLVARLPQVRPWLRWAGTRRLVSQEQTADKMAGWHACEAFNASALHCLTDLCCRAPAMANCLPLLPPAPPPAGPARPPAHCRPGSVPPAARGGLPAGTGAREAGAGLRAARLKWPSFPVMVTFLLRFLLVLFIAC